MLFRQKLRNFSQGSTPPSPVAHFFGMLLSGALGLSILALWISAASVYVDPRIFKWAALLGLLFPLFLLGTFILWIIGLLFVPRKTWLLGLLGLLFCSGSIRNYVAIHPFSETQETTAQPNKIKVHSISDECSNSKMNLCAISSTNKLISSAFKKENSFQTTSRSFVNNLLAPQLHITVATTTQENA